MPTQVDASEGWLHRIPPGPPALGKWCVQARASDPGRLGTVAAWALGQGAGQEPTLGTHMWCFNDENFIGIHGSPAATPSPSIRTTQSPWDLGQPGVPSEGRWVGGPGRDGSPFSAWLPLVLSSSSDPSQVDISEKEHWMESPDSATIRSGLPRPLSLAVPPLVNAVTEVKVHEKTPLSPVQAG